MLCSYKALVLSIPTWQSMLLQIKEYNVVAGTGFILNNNGAIVVQDESCAFILKKLAHIANSLTIAFW